MSCRNFTVDDDDLVSPKEHERAIAFVRGWPVVDPDTIEKARALVAVGHGVALGEPVHIGSYAWVEAARGILAILAALDTP